VDEELARRYWPNEDPIGKRIAWTGGDPPRWMEVVGVVGHVKLQAPETDPHVQFYVPYAQEPPTVMEIAVRTAGDPMAMLGAVRGAVRAVDADIPLSRINTMERRIEASAGQRRLSMFLLTVFSAIALVLASVGIYGVMAYSVAQRSRELGVRIALGATRRGVLNLVLRQGMALVAGGVVVGLFAAYALARLLTNQLYDVPATDPATFGAVALLLAGVAIGLAAAWGLSRLMLSLLYGVEATDLATFATVSLLLGGLAVAASYIPARRAARVDPVVSLRYE
jgi:putative ABC transport system permease protein